MQGFSVKERAEGSRLEVSYGHLPRLPVVLDYVSRFHKHLAWALFGIYGHLDGSFHQEAFDAAVLPVCLEIEGGAQNLYPAVSGTDEERVFRIVGNPGIDLTVDEDFPAGRDEVLRIGDAAAGIQKELAAVRKQKGVRGSYGNTLFNPFHGFQLPLGACQFGDDRLQDILSGFAAQQETQWQTETQEKDGCQRHKPFPSSPAGIRSGRSELGDFSEGLGHNFLELRVILVLDEPETVFFRLFGPHFPEIISMESVLHQLEEQLNAPSRVIRGAIF